MLELGDRDDGVLERAVCRSIADAVAIRGDTHFRGLSVRVEGSAVVITGTVSSWYERRAVERAAAAVPGVDLIDNRTTID